ncbi:MAG: hypothetical protein ACLUFI_03050 [Oscillospiraceae bacterium]
MAQTAGLVDLNVGLETVDYAVFAGHKTLLEVNRNIWFFDESYGESPADTIWRDGIRLCQSEYAR